MEDEILNQNVAFLEHAKNMLRLFVCGRTEQHRDQHHGVFSASGSEKGEEAADSFEVKRFVEGRAIGCGLWDCLNQFQSGSQLARRSRRPGV